MALWPTQQRDRDSQDTKHVIKYENMQKRMVEFLGKFENRGIEIARVNSIIITKSIDLQLFTLILYEVGGPLWWHL